MIHMVRPHILIQDCTLFLINRRSTSAYSCNCIKPFVLKVRFICSIIFLHSLVMTSIIDILYCRLRLWKEWMKILDFWCWISELCYFCECMLRDHSRHCIWCNCVLISILDMLVYIIIIWCYYHGSFYIWWRNMHEIEANGCHKSITFQLICISIFGFGCVYVYVHSRW